MRNYTFISIGSWALTKNNKIVTKTNQKLYWANWAKGYEEEEEEEEETERSQEGKSREEDGQTNEPKPAAGLIYKANKPKVKYLELEMDGKGLPCWTRNQSVVVLALGLFPLRLNCLYLSTYSGCGVLYV